MFKVREGEVLKCTICKKELDEELFWVIIRYEKEFRTLSCPQCGKEMIIQYYPEKDAFRLNKSCPCDILLAHQVFEQGPPKWNRKIYPFCDKCFKEGHGNIVFAELEKE